MKPEIAELSEKSPAAKVICMLYEGEDDVEGAVCRILEEEVVKLPRAVTETC